MTTTLQIAPSKPRARRLTVLRIAAILLLAVASFIAITYYRWTRSPLPQLDGETRLSGISAPVSIARDRWGVPHITASTVEDAFFAQGYAIAQDRLWQMDLLRRVANGELSEILGAGEGNAQLNIDKLHRAIGLRRIAEKSMPNLPEELLRTLKAYSRGVNAYIETHRDRLPFEFRLLRYEPTPWQPLDTLAIGKLMTLSLSNTWKSDLMRAELSSKLEPRVYKMLFDGRTPFDQPIVGEDLPSREETLAPSAPPIAPEIFASLREQWDSSEFFLDRSRAMIGSNNWALSGTRTSTGKPFLASDPHQGLTIPAIWHQVHIKVTDGSYHAAGISLIGGPGVVMGHNEHIAWSMTNLMADVEDLYVEEFDPNNPARYRVGDEWREAETIKEKISVRKSIFSSERSVVEHDVLITRHGPVISTANGQMLAMQWTGFSPESEFPAIYGINRSRNWEEFVAALKLCPGPHQNIVYADVNGNIGYYGIGRIPIRSSGDGSMPYNGRTGEGEWTGLVPFEEMPHLYNPPNGFIGTANQRVVGKSYPYHIANDWAPPYRAHRIYEELSSKERFTVEDMNRLQGDVYSAQVQLFAQEALKLAAVHKDDPQWQELQKEFDKWDGMLTAESRAAAVASKARKEFTEKFFNAWLGELRPVYDWYMRSAVIDRAITERPAEWLPKDYKDYDAMVIDCYKKAVGSLTAKLGADRSKWRYGAVNQLVFAHPLAKSSILKRLLNAPPIEIGGSANTVSAVNTGPDRVWGPSMRMIVSLANFDEATQCIVPGESGQFASDYYMDQIADWAALKPRPFPFNEAALQPLIVHRLSLIP